MVKAWCVKLLWESHGKSINNNITVSIALSGNDCPKPKLYIYQKPTNPFYTTDLCHHQVYHEFAQETF